MSAATHEMIALGVAGGMALGFVSLLIFLKGAAAGWPRARCRQLIVSLWLIVLALALFWGALRWLGGAIMGGAPAVGGFWLRMQSCQIAIVILAGLGLAGGLWGIRLLLRPLRELSPPRGKPAFCQSEQMSDEES